LPTLVDYNKDKLSSDIFEDKQTPGGLPLPPPPLFFHTPEG
jgi:hypothetical protein